MKLYSEHKDYKLYQGSMIDMLEVIEPESIDSIVTDPPYELNFMGKGWDNAGVSFQADTWKKCYEVLKPGGYLLAFGGSRTFHRIACAIEDAGFEIRDTIMWLYGSGFPKSMDIEKAINKRDGVKFISKPASGVGFMNTNNDGYHNTINQLIQEGESTDLAKQWQGWGTCLKPAFEPVIVARKPFKGSLVDNVINNGVGGLNIDECRVGNEERTQFSGRSQSKTTVYTEYPQENAHFETVTGRFPANVILTYDDTDYEEVCGGFPITKSKGAFPKKINGKSNITFRSNEERPQRIELNDSGSASRYFYCAKASKKDRDEGLDNISESISCDRDVNCYSADVPFNRSALPRKNTHPTVKPTTLMQYLVRLVTPINGTILDPFMGSGSTGKAVMYENKERQATYKFIGIEMTEEYLPICEARINHVTPTIIDSEFTVDDYLVEVI